MSEVYAAYLVVTVITIMANAGAAVAEAWNVWYRATANGGASWSHVVRVSNRGSGAPYKSPAGFRFPYGDYFGITVDSHGTSYLIWSEGTNYIGPGGTWQARAG